MSKGTPINSKAPNAAKQLPTYEQEYLEWYHREVVGISAPFDPSGLVAAAREQWTPWPALVDALQRCTTLWYRSDLYAHFLSPKERNARWDFAGSLFLRHPDLGMLVMDVIHDPNGPGGFAIGGMEYFDRAMGREPNRGDARVIPIGPHVAPDNTHH